MILWVECMAVGNSSCVLHSVSGCCVAGGLALVGVWSVLGCTSATAGGRGARLVWVTTLPWVWNHITHITTLPKASCLPQHFSSFFPQSSYHNFPFWTQSEARPVFKVRVADCGDCAFHECPGSALCSCNFSWEQLTTQSCAWTHRTSAIQNSAWTKPPCVHNADTPGKRLRVRKTNIMKWRTPIPFRSICFSNSWG
jgi:hypothetical protein